MQDHNHSNRIGKYSRINIKTYKICLLKFFKQDILYKENSYSKNYILLLSIRWAKVKSVIVQSTFTNSNNLE